MHKIRKIYKNCSIETPRNGHDLAYAATTSPLFLSRFFFFSFLFLYISFNRHWIAEVIMICVCRISWCMIVPPAWAAVAEQRGAFDTRSTAPGFKVGSGLQDRVRPEPQETSDFFLFFELKIHAPCKSGPVCI